MDTDRATRDLLDVAALALQLGQHSRATQHPDGEPERVTTHTTMLVWVACMAATVYNSGLPEDEHDPDAYDVGLVAQLASVHDLPEAPGGDTNSFDISAEDKAAKGAREAEALAMLRRRWMGGPWLLPTLERYEARACREAHLVDYWDKVVPKLVHALNGCADLRAMGKTRADLQRVTRKQRAELAARYPDVAAWCDPLLGAIFRAAEEAWEESPSTP